MKFDKFKNGTNYIEYLQIFCYKKILIDGSTEFHMLEYNEFELTDVIINKYNTWISQGSPNFHRITEWIDNNQEGVNHFRMRFGTLYKAKVSIWSDRKKTTYYKTKLQDSFEFENYIASILKDQFGLDIGAYMTPQGQYELGENALGIEIKNDTLIEKYGNVYIEYQEKSAAGNYSYINSGILKEDNCKYFLIGTEKKFYIFRKERLLQIFKEELSLAKQGKPSRRGIMFKQIPTSRGIAYPVKYAINDTITFEEMVKEIKEQKK